MPFYTFSIRNKAEIKDPEPLEFPDLASAVEEARQGARELLADGIRFGRDRRHWFLEIADEAGHLLTRFRFEDALQDDTRRSEMEIDQDNVLLAARRDGHDEV